ncbi:MAG: hypothetical protein K2J13_04690 [Clostridia bacterium]|nr:hypothetical protein [Clostridia bacterium]
MKISKPITYITTTLLVLSLCLMFLTILFIGNTLTNDYASADTIQYSPRNVAVEQENLEYFYDSMNILENELEDNHTSVLEQLNKQLTRYTDMLNNQTYNDLDNIKCLIATTENLIEEYEKYENRNISRAPYHAIYTPMIAAVIAYFNSNDYVLSAELLTHAKDNEILDSKHTIENTSVIQSSDLFKELANGEETYGESAFEKTGKTEDDDLYYAIHQFEFEKESEYSHSIRIIDSYDYEERKKPDSIEEKAINQMYKAQQAGALIPFKISEYVTDTGLAVLYDEDNTYSEYAYLYKNEN